MKLIRQPNRWTCIPAAFAMVVEADLRYIIEKLGHDGSEILWPELPEPIRRKGFHIEEMQYIAFGLHRALVPFVFNLIYAPDESLKYRQEYTYNTVGIMTGYSGILLGAYKGSPNAHAVAWNASEGLIYDPSGHFSTLDSFQPDSFHALVRL